MLKGSSLDDKESKIELLKLFIERVDKLRNSSYVRAIHETPLKLTISGNMAEKTLLFKNTDVNPEHVDAFLFTLRLFIQEKDSISVEKMGSMIGSLEVSKEPKVRFFKQKEFLDKFLSEQSMMRIDDDLPTNNDVLRTVLYGFRGHLKTEEPKYRRYKEWSSNPIALSIIEFTFNSVLITYIEALTVMAGNCRIMLDELLVASADI
jgi:hypothetical protein